MNDIAKKEAILVVDDSASIRDMVSFTLDSAGYEACPVRWSRSNRSPGFRACADQSIFNRLL